MILWLDEQLSPLLGPRVAREHDIECVSVVSLPINRASDLEIFMAARAAGAVIATKDSDFVDLLARYGPPPQLIWLTCGNRSNAEMRALLAESLANALQLLASGEAIVEIT